MNKKDLAVRVICLLIMLFCASVNSASAAKKEAQLNPAEISAQQAKEAQLKAREKLKAGEWVIYVSPMSGQPGTMETDALTFGANDTVSSKNLIAQGFGASNYRLSVEAGGLAVWETMQANADNDVAFLRGELRGEVMTGTIFIKPHKGQNKTYNFATVKPAEADVIEAPKKKGKR